MGKAQVTVVARVQMRRASTRSAIPRGGKRHDAGRPSEWSSGVDEMGSDTAGGEGAGPTTGEVVIRYANCFRGSSETNVHAEEFLFEDQKLLNTIRGGRVSC
jgi:hypothetical protein